MLLWGRSRVSFQEAAGSDLAQFVSKLSSESLWFVDATGNTSTAAVLAAGLQYHSPNLTHAGVDPSENPDRLAASSPKLSEGGALHEGTDPCVPAVNR